MAQNSNARKRVERWYEACLISVGEQSNRSYSNGILAETILLARKGDAWQYRPCREVWIADEQTKADAFSDEVWQIEFNVSQRLEAARYFNLSTLSTAVEMAFGWEHQLPQQSQQLQDELDAIKEYLFAWRRSHIKTDPDELRSMLQSLRVLVVDGLHADLTLEGIGIRRLEEVPWGTKDGQLLVSVEHWEDRAVLMAQAVARTVGPESDADFYENLLRCQNHRDRTAKLVAKGLTRTQVEQLTMAFREEFPPQPELATQLPAAGATDVHRGAARSPAREVPSRPSTEDQSSTPPARETESLLLKDVGRANIRFSSTPREGRSIEIRDYETQRGQREVLQLSREQRDEVEQAARAAAARMLEDAGYLVTHMPIDNPGYDLKAVKPGVELHVEVKGHLSDPSVLTITSRQLLDYGAAQRFGDHRWELWNVANLCSTSAGINITRYRHIPPDALTERQLSLDLTKCIPVDHGDLP